MQSSLTKQKLTISLSCDFDGWLKDIDGSLKRITITKKNKARLVTKPNKNLQKVAWNCGENKRTSKVGAIIRLRSDPLRCTQHAVSDLYEGN